MNPRVLEEKRKEARLEVRMREASLIPVLLSLASSKSASYSYTSSTFPDIYSFHTGDWPFDVQIPTYPPPR